jgi:sterol 3beta-glucosyltransferase
MHILIFSFGTRGDVQPYVALGAALKARGHKVTISTGRGFDDLIEGHGLDSAPIAFDIRELMQDPEVQDALRTFSGKIRAWRRFRGLFRGQFDDMWQVARQVRPDVIVAHPKAFPAHDIGEALGVVSLPSVLQPISVPTGDFPQFLVPAADLGRFTNRLSYRLFNRLSAWGQGKAMGDWRETVLGLPPMRLRSFMAGYSPDGETLPHLHGYSGVIVPKPDDWGPQEHVTGYWFLDQAGDFRPPADLERFLSAGPPPVYVGFGSMPTPDAERQTEVVTEALRLAGQRGILASGWGGLSNASGAALVHVLDGAPHDWLFPRCAAVVHHGGSGTTHEGLKWGRPTIVCPFGVDQPFWGRRVNRLGAGPPPLPQKRLTADRLAGAIRDALRRETVARATAVGEQVRREGGATEAALLVEDAAPVKARAAP